MVRGSFGDVARSLAPVSSSTYNTRFHVAPPSVVLYTPRSPPAPNSGPVAATSTVLSFDGSIRMRPMCFESRSPTLVNVFPPSVDLKTPSPHEVLCRLFDSPEPSQSTSGFDCDTVTSPIDISPLCSKTGVRMAPLLVVFHTPPCAVPTYQM